MACKNAYKAKTNTVEQASAAVQAAAQTTIQKTEAPSSVSRLLFGVDSKIQSNDLLQNNITEFEWATRNKIYPNFWGRYINGENRLTKDEIGFLHEKGCKIAAIYKTADKKESEDQGKIEAKKAAISILELGIPKGTAIFLEIAENEKISRDYMKGFAQVLLEEGYTPSFKANTDAAFDFDREFSRGLQTDKDIFDKCLVWATAPSLKEYERVTTTHLIHPDNWTPFAPSGITRNDIAVWQYGKNCHPILDDSGKETTFNVNLVRNEQVIIEKMF